MSAAPAAIAENEVEGAGWRYWSDGADLLLFCLACADRECASVAPASSDA